MWYNKSQYFPNFEKKVLHGTYQYMLLEAQ